MGRRDARGLWRWKREIANLSLVTVRMTPALIWAATRAILMSH